MELKNLPEEDGLKSRAIALAALDAVLFHRRTLDEALAADAASWDALSARDRAFARLLVTLVLKRAPQVDAALQALLHGPLAKLAPPRLLNILRLGAAQLAFLGTPPHAAVDSSVRLTEAAVSARQKSLVNAVLRRLARQGFPALSDRDAGKVNTPPWLWAEWMQDYGVETALGIAAAHLGDAPLDVTVARADETALWAQRLGMTVLPNGTLRRADRPPVPSLPGFDDGAWWVQGASAALPARLLGAVAGKTVVDMCAAPGGKTAQLAAMGAHVIAVDRSAARMQRLKDNLRRLRLAAQTVVADAAVWRPDQPVDAVLLDVPCTATGTLRHQPDLGFLKTPGDQAKMAILQARLLAQAATFLRPGGALLYCTCSLQKAEGENIVADFLKATPGFARRLFTAAEVGGMEESLTPDGDLRCLPMHWRDHGGMDGFFIARLVAPPL